MKKTRFWLMLLLLVSAGNIFASDMRIEVLNHPDTVQLYIPAYAVVALTNASTTKISVAYNPNDAQNGYWTEVSGPNLHLNTAETSSDFRVADVIVDIKAQESIYMLADVGIYFGAEGIHEVRFRLNGSGVCQIQGRNTKPCWKGNAISNSATINVVRPVLQEDLNAIEYMRSGQVYRDMNQHHIAMGAKTEKMNGLLSVSYDMLKKKFPTSTYTFAAAIYRATRMGGGDPIAIMNEEVASHPNHPLIEYARVIQAMITMREKVRPTRTDRDSLPDIDIDSLRLASPFDKFLRYYKADMMNRSSRQDPLVGVSGRPTE